MTSYRLANLGTIVLVACAVAVTASTIRRDLAITRGTSRERPAMVSRKVPEWRQYASGHSLGPEGAAATVVEFADFQCPACRLFNGEIDSLRATGVQVRLIYRHFPLATHPAAMGAVRASECAADQDAFPAMHKALFAHADSLGVAQWTWFAQEAGVRDLERFKHCAAASSPILALAADTLAARKLGIRGTPLLLINDLLVEGALPVDSLRVLIGRAPGNDKR